ncbi:MAG: hypothetical protein IPO29_00780 [Anaerolineae bacterium]|nr:hypothetical protein [Anaerolineae bacterium]
MMVWLLALAGGLAVFLIVAGTAGNAGSASGSAHPMYRPRTARSLGKAGPSAVSAVVRAGAGRALRADAVNARYLRQLKQADWYWAPAEPAPLKRRAPFWNLETLWAEKYFGVLLGGAGAAGLILLAGMIGLLTLEFTGASPVGLAVPALGVGAALVGGLGAALGFTSPDAQLAAAAFSRQRELSLELGFRIGEIRSDVLAGVTLPTAIGNLSRRAGGPFIEELRRMTTALKVDADEVAAVNTLLDRNQGNEFVIEFGNTVRMALLHGARVESALNALADAAQIRLRQTIQAQGRRNAQEMARPVALTTTLVISMLVIAPAIAGIVEGIG